MWILGLKGLIVKARQPESFMLRILPQPTQFYPITLLVSLYFFFIACSPTLRNVNVKPAWFCLSVLVQIKKFVFMTKTPGSV